MTSKEERTKTEVRDRYKIVGSIDSHALEYECGCLLPTHNAERSGTYQATFCGPHYLRIGMLVDDEATDDK